MILVYIAGPFRGKDSWEMENNIRRAEELALKVWQTGFAAALCPHSNTRFFQGAAPDGVWLAGDLLMLSKCDAMVLTTDWRRSAGSVKEVKFALQNDIPIFEDVFELFQHNRGNTAVRLTWDDLP
jgi:hypothetical protein